MANGQANSEVSEAFSPALTCDHESPIVCAGFSGGQGAKAGGIGYEDDVAPTIRSAESGSNQVPDVICYENHAQDSRIKPCGEYSPQINAKAGTGAQVELAHTQNATGVMGVSVNTSVRRLLPVECERLMGFPDNWTRIRWKGRPEEECPDSPRYKACGNSMCVNVMRWIGMRIELTERKLK